MREREKEKGREKEREKEREGKRKEGNRTNGNLRGSTFYFYCLAICEHNSWMINKLDD